MKIASNKSRHILQAISTMEELDINKLNDLNLGVEIQDFVEPNLSQEEVIDARIFYKNNFKDFKGIKALHGPFLDLKPSSPDKIIREASHQKYLNALRIAKELEIDFIIFHSQINPYLNQPKLVKLNNLQAREFWVQITDEIQDFQGTILLENIFEETPHMLRELVETINLPNIKINLDIGHAKLSKVELDMWIRELRDHIAYIHIHSNDGVYDLHESPSKEEIIRLYDLLDKYNIDPVLSLEYRIENIYDEIKKYK